MHGSMVFAWLRQCAAYLMYASLGPRESTTQTPYRSVQPFFHSSRQRLDTLYNVPPLLLLKLPLPMR